MLVNLLEAAFNQLATGHSNLDLTLNTVRILLRSEALRSVVDNEKFNIGEIAKVNILCIDVS